MFERVLAQKIRFQKPPLTFFSRALCSTGSKMELREVVSRLKNFAPLSLAEKWDNVGLLVEPSGKHVVNSVLLTNDLTEPVMEEACQKKVNMIISYHPPIFTPLKRLTSQNMKERIVIKALEERIAVYSPHTAFDAVKGGVNDWLASGLGVGEISPLSYSMTNSPCGEYRLKVNVNVDEHLDVLINSLHSTKDVIATVPSSPDDIEHHGKGLSVLPLVVYCSGLESLKECLSVMENVKTNSTVGPEILCLGKHPLSGTGQGRLLHLKVPVSLEEMVTRIKRHLNLKHLRIAFGTPPAESITTVAMCAGSGASVLKGVKADLYLTGEMSHHDVIDATSRGVHVILCEHSNTERGFLTEFSKTLESLLDSQVSIHVSETDKDPLSVI